MPGDAAPDGGLLASFAIAATDPASDLASISGIVRVSSGSPEKIDGAADGASDGAADAPRATLCDPSRTSSSDASAVPGLDITVGSGLFSENSPTVPENSPLAN